LIDLIWGIKKLVDGKRLTSVSFGYSNKLLILCDLETLIFFDYEERARAMSWGGKREGAGRTPAPRLTQEELEALIQEQVGLCALCAEPGSVGGLVADIDGLRKSVRGMLHPKCKAFLVLGRDNPRRFQMAIAYLEQRAAAPPRVIVGPGPAGVPKSPEKPGAEVIAST